MNSMKDLFKTADWKTEKHVPMIQVVSETPSEKGKDISINISVGKEITHPNTTEHHINWISAFFLPEDSKFPYQIAHFDFSAHGASVDGQNASTVYTNPTVTFSFKTARSGILIASSYCNIHGLWENSEKVLIS